MIWVVGKYRTEDRWELQGVFSSKDLALAYAKSGEFVGPVLLDQRLPDETTP